MKLIEPKVELWSEIGISPESHIARCARVCYGHEDKAPNQEADEKMVEGLYRREHYSMFRHSSIYEMPQVRLQSEYINSKFVGAFTQYASYNRQYYFEKPMTKGIEMTPEEFLNVCRVHGGLFGIFRLTFCITTQISTSRELNRVSPNNIAERSTRYCSSKDGLEICKPWWLLEDEKQGPVNITNRSLAYINACEKAEHIYRLLLNEEDMKPEDARGVLPLDTATKVVYTYPVEKWCDILELRYYGTTGRPHPNAKLVMGMVRDQINAFAKEHNIEYEV